MTFFENRFFEFDQPGSDQTQGTIVTTFYGEGRGCCSQDMRKTADLKTAGHNGYDGGVITATGRFEDCGYGPICSSELFELVYEPSSVNLTSGFDRWTYDI